MEYIRKTVPILLHKSLGKRYTLNIKNQPVNFVLGSNVFGANKVSKADFLQNLYFIITFTLVFLNQERSFPMLGVIAKTLSKNFLLKLYGNDFWTIAFFRFIG